MNQEELLPQDCNFCPNIIPEDSDATILGISACDDCLDKYLANPIEFEKKVMSAF